MGHKEWLKKQIQHRAKTACARSEKRKERVKSQVGASALASTWMQRQLNLNCVFNVTSTSTSTATAASISTSTRPPLQHQLQGKPRIDNLSFSFNLYPNFNSTSTSTLTFTSTSKKNKRHHATCCLPQLQPHWFAGPGCLRFLGVGSHGEVRGVGRKCLSPVRREETVHFSSLQ